MSSPIKFFDQSPVVPIPCLIASGNFTTSYSANTALKFQTVGYDPLGAYSTATGQFICPVKGIYRVSGSAGGNFSNGAQVYISQNGDTAYYGGTGVTIAGGVGPVTTRLVLADAGDTLDIRITTGSTISSDVYNNLSIELVRELE